MVSVAQIQQIDTKSADGGLANVFKAAKVNPTLIEEFTKDEVTTINEFASYFTLADYEKEAKDFVKDRNEALASKPVEVSRLRTAILLARGVLGRTEAPNPADQGVSDMEAPIDPAEREAMAQAWDKRYGTALTMWLDPEDRLVNRLWREFRKNTPSCIEVKHVRSVYTSHKPGSERKVNLTGGLVLTMDGQDQGEEVRSVAQYYYSLRILANACAKAGNFETESKTDKGGKVIFAPLDLNMDYADHAFRMALSQPTTGFATLRWLENRDHYTRSQMVIHMRRGYPQGEALTKALEDCELKWQSPLEPGAKGPENAPRGRSRSPRRGQNATGPRNDGGKGKRKQSLMGKTQSNSMGSREGQRYASYVKGGKKVCRAYNMGQCNTNPCPHGGMHVCSVITQGKTCGLKHPATKHQFSR